MAGAARTSFPMLRAVLRVGVRQALRELWVTGEVRGGALVGRDRYGNEYYEVGSGRSGGAQAADADTPFYRTRYVLPRGGDAEASVVPPEWHGWLHKTVDEHPAEAISFAGDPATADSAGGSEANSGGIRALKQSDGTVRKVWPWQAAHTANATGTPRRYVPYSTVKPRINAFRGRKGS